MLLRVMSGMLLGLLVSIACSDNNEEGEQPADSDNPNDKSGYALVITSDDDMRNNGNGKVTVQLTKDGKPVTDAKDTKVELTIVCDDNPAVELEGLLTEAGKTVINADLNNDDWTIDDYGTCKLSAATTVGGETVEVKDVVLSTTDGQTAADSGQCMKEGGCDEDAAHAFKIGEEIGIDTSLTSGTLSLHGCSAAVLYTVAGSSISRATNNSVAVTDTGTPAMFVLGTAGNNCVLQHTDAGETREWATLADAAAGDNKAVFDVSDLYMFKYAAGQNILRVDLPAKPADVADTVALHVSQDGGMTWGAKESEAGWGLTFSTVEFDNAKPLSHELLFRVTTTNDTVWWGHYTQRKHIVVPDVTIGKAFKVTGLAHSSSAGIDFATKVVEGCGLHFFSSGSSPDKIKRITTATPIAIHSGRGGGGNLGTINLLAVNNGTASHTSGCKVKLNIAGFEFEAKRATAAGTRPDTSITVSRHEQKQNKAKIALPAWQSSWGTASGAKLYYSTDGGDNWGEDNFFASWSSQASSYSPGTWKTPVTANQALVSVNVTPAGGNATTWWYYAQGS